MGALVYALKTLGHAYPEAFSWVPGFFVDTPFMMMAFYLLAACIAMQVLFTFRYPKGADEDPEKLYWSRPLDALKDPGWPGIGNYKLLGGALIAVMIALYIVFR